MTTWKERYSIYIDKLHEQMPPDATLQDRIKYLRKNIPSDATTYSHGRKSWQAARRSYLARFGYLKKGLGETPMERMMRRGARYD